MMQVVFVMSLDGDRVASVSWQEGGAFVGRQLMEDGTLIELKHDNALHLSDVARELAGGNGQSFGAEVDDIRSALKYLGKSPDLVEMLPRVNIWQDAPRRETDNESENWKRFFSDAG